MCTTIATATQLQHGEMRLLHQQQPGLGLDLCVVERALRERDRGALAVDDPLPGRVALAAGPRQRDVEQSQRQLVALAEPQRLPAPGTRRWSRRPAAARPPAPPAPPPRRPPPTLRERAAPGRCGSSPRPQSRGDLAPDRESAAAARPAADAMRGTTVATINSSEPSSSERSSVKRRELLRQATQCVGGGLRRPATRDDRAPPQPGRRLRPRRQRRRPTSRRCLEMLLGRLELHRGHLVATRDRSGSPPAPARRGIRPALGASRAAAARGAPRRAAPSAADLQRLHPA